MRLVDRYDGDHAQMSAIETDYDRLMNAQVAQLVQVMANMDQADTDGAALSEADQNALNAAIANA